MAGDHDVTSSDIGSFPHRMDNANDDGALEEVRGAVKKMIYVAALAVLSGCGSTSSPDVDFEGTLLTTPIELTLQFGEDRVVEGTALRMTFAAAIGDSRCPSDVVCVWEGNGEVEIGISVGMGPTHALRLNTTVEPRSVEWNDVLVTLLELMPDPLSDEPIADADYSVKLRLDPMS